MRPLKSSQRIVALVALGVVAALLLVPHPAQASKALFRVQRSFLSVFAIPDPSSQPPQTKYAMTVMGMKSKPYATVMYAPATAYVFKTANQVVLPKSFIQYYDIAYCGDYDQGMCFMGYPISGGISSNYNGQGRFGAGGASMGFPGPTAVTTVVFPTTNGNKLPFGDNTKMGMDTGLPNLGTGAPVTPTTAFSGRYDFKRAGSIQVTPGPNKFSGTMRILFGPNGNFYQFITKFKPDYFRAYGGTIGPPSSDTTNLGEVTSSGPVTRFLLTDFQIHKQCLATPSCQTGPYPRTAGCKCDATAPYTMNYVSAQAHYLALLVPWTSGRVEGYQGLGTYLTRLTQTGGDDKAPAMTPSNKIGYMGSVYPTRILSLVRPRLRHNYLRDSQDPNNIITNFQAFRIQSMKVMFLPEPGGVVLLAAGIAGLVGLARLRRR